MIIIAITVIIITIITITTTTTIHQQQQNNTASNNSNNNNNDNNNYPLVDNIDWKTFRKPIFMDLAKISKYFSLNKLAREHNVFTIILLIIIKIKKLDKCKKN